MPINKTYRTWIQRICELRPKQRKTQVQNFVWLIVGIFHSRSVSLSKIAGKVISTAKNVSTVRRLSRFLASSVVDVRSWYRSTAKAWLISQAHQAGEIRLIVDGSKVGFGHQLLMVSLAYRRRAIPIAWAWVHHVRGHSTATKQIVLLKYVRSLISQKTPVFFGRRQRIWLDCSLATTQTVAMVLCSTPKRQHWAVARWTNRLAEIGWSGTTSWAVRLASKWLLDPEWYLSSFRLDPLAEGRETTLVFSNQSAWCFLDLTLLPQTDVDWRDVCWFQETRLWFGSYHVTQSTTLISFDFGCGFPLCLAPFGWQSHHSIWATPFRGSQGSTWLEPFSDWLAFHWPMPTPLIIFFTTIMLSLSKLSGD